MPIKLDGGFGELGRLMTEIERTNNSLQHVTAVHRQLCDYIPYCNKEGTCADVTRMNGIQPANVVVAHGLAEELLDLWREVRKIHEASGQFAVLQPALPSQHVPQVAPPPPATECPPPRFQTVPL